MEGLGLSMSVRRVRDLELEDQPTRLQRPTQSR